MEWWRSNIKDVKDPTVTPDNVSVDKYVKTYVYDRMSSADWQVVQRNFFKFSPGEKTDSPSLLKSSGNVPNTLPPSSAPEAIIKLPPHARMIRE